jgi:CRISPR-associated protein Cmr6
MPLHIPHDTSLALGADAKGCSSRSLYASRFADPTSKEGPRKEWFNRLIGRKAEVPPVKQTATLSWHPPTSKLLHARLQSRLMVNMAGGVMENAGLSLDRYGLPIIPGSAVKGCARRAALAALREWCETKTKPEGVANLFTPLCADFKTPADHLFTIAHVFGWVELDWSTEKTKARLWQSDLAWTCEHDMAAFHAVFTQLGKHKQFAGNIAFLPASPSCDPGLVLDVVTPHHTAYYEGRLPTATDTEEPVPVLFPAVKEQGENEYFTFPLIPLRGASDADLAFAKLALSTGLETFGLGAKTNAGYGWFDASEAFNDRVTERRVAEIRLKEEQEHLAAEKERQEAEAKAKAEAKALLAKAMEGLSPEQQEDKKLELLSEAQFEAKVRAFCKEPKKGGPTEPEKQAIVRALRGPRLGYWQIFKTKATKGDLATVAAAIYALSKTLNLGKMP